MNNRGYGVAAVLLAVILLSPRESECGAYRRILNARGVAQARIGNGTFCYDYPLYDLVTERLVGNYDICASNIIGDPNCPTVMNGNGTATTNLTIDGSGIVYRG